VISPELGFRPTLGPCPKLGGVSYIFPISRLFDANEKPTCNSRWVFLFQCSWFKRISGRIELSSIIQDFGHLTG
jgi:hypothetical protein